MRTASTALLAGTLLSLGAVPAAAQMVAGIVRDRRTGGLVENVSIALRDEADSAVARTRSDSGGTFYLVAPRPGTYTLRFNVGAGPERTTPALVLAAEDALHQSAYIVEVPEHLYFFEFQVEEPVVPLNTVAPAYPANLQAEAVSGEVIAQFVVDTLGRANLETFRAIEATHHEFVTAVRQALPRMRFQPARLRGRAVQQLVQQAFAFKMGRMPARAAPWPPPLPPLPRTIPPR